MMMMDKLHLYLLFFFSVEAIIAQTTQREERARGEKERAGNGETVLLCLSEFFLLHLIFPGTSLSPCRPTLCMSMPVCVLQRPNERDYCSDSTMAREKIASQSSPFSLSLFLFCYHQSCPSCLSSPKEIYSSFFSLLFLFPIRSLKKQQSKNTT